MAVGVSVAVGDGVAVTAAALPHASNSASPTFTVPAPTESTVNRTPLTSLAGNVTVVADPSLCNDPTATVEPSENVNVPAVTQSFAFGRSKSTTRSKVTDPAQPNSIHAPTR